MYLFCRNLYCHNLNLNLETNSISFYGKLLLKSLTLNAHDVKALLLNAEASSRISKLAFFSTFFLTGRFFYIFKQAFVVWSWERTLSQ